MNLGYTLQQKNHKALLMIDYYKQKIEIYMTQDAYNLFRLTCDDKVFKKIALSSIRFSETKSAVEKKELSRRGFIFMIEVPKNYSAVVWHLINENPEICAGVFNEPKEEQKEDTLDAPLQTVVDTELDTKVNTEANTEKKQTTALNISNKVVQDKPRAENKAPKTLLNIMKRPHPDGLVTEIYMTQDAQRQFRAACSSRLLDTVSFGIIKYDTNKKHITKRGYDFMLEVPKRNIAKVWQIINSNPDIRNGVYSDMKQNNTAQTMSCNRPIRQNVQHLAQQKRTHKPKCSEIDLEQTHFKFQDLTLELAGKILGISSHNFDAIYFYNHKYKYFDNYDEIREIIESHPFYTGRKLAAIAIVATTPYEHWPYFIKNPTIVYKETRNRYPECNYDTRGTFISYNTSTKQFEKHPAGWVTLSSDEKPINAFLSMIKSKTDYVMADFACKQCTK